jgi:hypothetical protein
MTREKWLEHIQAVCGLKPMEKTAEYATWVEAVRWHHTACPDCPECKSRKKTRRATASRMAREEAYKLAGLVKGRTGLGRVIWE